MTSIRRIGDRWAREIEKAFLLWAESATVDNSFMPVVRFDPTPYSRTAFLEAEAAQIKELGKILGTAIRIDLINPEAIAWIQKHGAERVRYIDGGIRATIREIVRRGVIDGLTMEEQKRLIRRYIGLLPRHVVFLERYRESLESLGYPSRVIDRALERQRMRLLNYRAKTIALTEGHTAANEGMRAVTNEAARRGILDTEKYCRQWLITPDARVCPFCLAMRGTTADIPYGRFPDGSVGPPKHPRCRCTEVIVKK